MKKDDTNTLESCHIGTAKITQLHVKIQRGMILNRVYIYINHQEVPEDVIAILNEYSISVSDGLYFIGTSQISNEMHIMFGKTNLAHRIYQLSHANMSHWKRNM